MNLNDGILLIDKPKGLTSHDVVDVIRRKFKFKKVGHAGTLDPMATGLLIILVGSFTKKSAHFLNYDKEYEAELLLGVSTDTADAEGKVIDKKDLNVSKEEIEKAFKSFRGEIKQIPPMFSAKKIKGKPLYKYARKGMVLKREPKTVLIEKLEIKTITFPSINFYVKCSKGTYVRQLAHDIGEKIGSGAHLTSLRRTKIGPFDVKNAISPAKLQDYLENNEKNLIHENILQP